MMKNVSGDPAQLGSSNWQELFEAAVVEEDPQLLPLRLQHARDAIVGKIEDSFETASSSDRLLLLSALNTVSGLFETTIIDRTRASRGFGHSA
jgi:hypothetical protein